MGLEEAIRKTVIYAGKYNCELTGEEVKERLIASESYDFPVTSFKFKIKNENRYWKKKMEKASEFVDKYLVKIDDILMVGVTGSVASKYPKENDDIDLMIITKKNSLWLTRFRVYLSIWKNKIPHRTDKDNYCLNLWLDEDGIQIPKIKQNLKNAIDLILMRPILDKQKTYKKFLVKNSWVKKYVANPYKQKLI